MFILWKNEEKNLLHHHWKLNASKRIAHKIPLVNWFKLYLRTYCPACSVNTQQIKDYVIHGKIELFLVDKKTSKERLTILESFICWKKIALSRYKWYEFIKISPPRHLDRGESVCGTFLCQKDSKLSLEIEESDHSIYNGAHLEIAQNPEEATQINCVPLT